MTDEQPTSAPAPATGAPSQSALERIMQKYQRTSPESPRELVTKKFELDSNKTKRERLSKTPNINVGNDSMSALWGEFKAYQLKMLDFADTYDKLNLNFRDLLKNPVGLSRGEAIKCYVYQKLHMHKQFKKVWVDASMKRGKTIEDVVERIGQVMEERHQTAIQLISKMRGVESKNIAHIKFLDEEVIRHLREGYTGNASDSELLKAIDGITKDLNDLDATLLDYENKVTEAKTAGQVDAVKKLIDEMTGVLNIKHEVMEGKRASDSALAELRRDLLDHAKGSEAAKSAIASSLVNYNVILTMLDSFYEQEIMFRYIKMYSLDVFRIQGQIAAGLQEGFKNKDVIKQYAEITAKLMELLPKMAAHLDIQTWDQFTTPIYDIDKANEIRLAEEARRKEFGELKMQYVELNQKATDIGQQMQAERQLPHYTSPK